MKKQNAHNLGEKYLMVISWKLACKLTNKITSKLSNDFQRPRSIDKRFQEGIKGRVKEGILALQINQRRLHMYLSTLDGTGFWPHTGEMWIAKDSNKVKEIALSTLNGK